MRKILSPAQKAREKREARIVELYHRLCERYERKMDLYTDIADKAGCGYNKVIRVLQAHGIIQPKKARS